jgi:hypothetical protein
MAKSSTSFAKGNQAGAGTRFAPGQTGNAGGKPKWKPWADAYRKFGGLPITQLQITKDDTTIEAVVKKAYQEMLKAPDVRAAREAADRTEGRVPLPLIGSSDEPIKIVINSLIPRPDRSKGTPTKKVPKNVQ